MEYKRILFVNLDRIGDVVRSTFLFRLLKQRFPSSYLACLSAAPADELLANDPYVDDVFCLPHQEVRASTDEQKTVLHMSFSVLRLLNMLKLHDFDLIINPFSEFGALASRYLRPQYMLGRSLNDQGRFIVYGQETAKFVYIMSNQKGLRKKVRHSFVKTYSCILKDIGISVMPEALYPNIFIGPREASFAQGFLKDHLVRDDEVIVGMQVGAFTPDKQWPVKKYAELAESLQSRYSVRILITGSAQESKKIIPELISYLQTKPIVAAGQTTLMQSAALIKKCGLFISNDTGPMHIAAALGIPVVALFGLTCTVPEESQPWGSSHRVVCKDRIEDITVSAAHDAVRDLLTSTGIRTEQVSSPELFS